MSEISNNKAKEELENSEKIGILTLDLLRQRYDKVLERTTKLDDEARQLIGSILVVVGFLLGSGAIALLSESSYSLLLYFIGIVVLVISILFAFRDPNI